LDSYIKNFKGVCKIHYKLFQICRHRFKIQLGNYICGNRNLTKVLSFSMELIIQMKSNFQLALLSFNSHETADALLSNISFPLPLPVSREDVDVLLCVRPTIEGLLTTADLSLDV